MIELVIAVFAGIAAGLLIPIWLNLGQKENNMDKELSVRYPVAFHTVDIAIVKMVETEFSVKITHVLLIQKPHEIKDGHWRFPGGFVDPTDDSAEFAAVREAGEETKLVLDGDVKYIGSTRIDDPRYRDSPHKIITSFYRGRYLSGKVGKGFDDVAVTQWFPINELPKQNPIHSKLFEMLKKNVDTMDHAFETLNKIKNQITE